MKSLLDKQPSLKSGAVILAVSVDSPESTKKLLAKLEAKAGQTQITYLEDRDHKVIDRYGLFNPGNRLNIPHPATFVIDRAGIVRWRFVEVDYKVRPSNAQVIAAIKQAQL